MNKLNKALDDNVKIVLPSLQGFFEYFDRALDKNSAVLDSKKVLSMNEKERYNYLIENFHSIASKALMEAFIETGYKREEKKKWKMNWF
jgi:DNA-binding transcriptional regulator YbjK